MTKFSFSIQRIIYLFTCSILITLSTGCARMHSQHMDPSNDHQRQDKKSCRSEQNHCDCCLQPIPDTSDPLWERFKNILSQENPNEKEIKAFEEILNDPNNSYHAKPADPDGSMPIFMAVLAQTINNFTANTEIIKLLLKKSLNNDIQINTPGHLTEDERYTPLMLACRSNKPLLVELLVAHEHTDIGHATNVVNNSNTFLSALDIATFFSSKECIPYLVGNKKFNMKDIMPPLNYAIYNANLIIVETLLESGYRSNRDELIAVLQKHQIDYTNTPKKKNQPIHRQMNGAIIFAALQESNIEGLKLLLKYKALTKNQYNEEGITPLIFAIQRNNIEAVNTLVQHGTDVSEKSRAGHSPLYYALQAKGEVACKIIEALVYNPQNMTAGTGSKKTGSCQDNCYICTSSDALWMDDDKLVDMLTPLIINYYTGAKKQTELKKRTQCAVVKIIKSIDLQSKGASCDGTYNYETPTIDKLLPQIIAKYLPYPNKDKPISLEGKIIDQLLTYSGAIGEIEIGDRTLVSYIAAYGYIDLIEKLKSNPCFANDDWDRTTKDNRTPLSYAVHPGTKQTHTGKKNLLSRNHVLIVQKLIEKKADINKTDSHGKSILSYALDNDLTQPTGQDILKHLLNHKNISSSIQNLELAQYNQLFQFIVNRPSTAKSRLPLMQLNDRLVKMLESPHECDKEDQPFIEYFKKTAQDQQEPIFSVLQDILHSNKEKKQPMVLAIQQNRIDLIEALLPYQSIEEPSLPFWKMCLAAVCEEKNVQILQLLSKKLTQNEGNNILKSLLNTPLDKDQKTTALFYTIEHSSQRNVEASAFIAALIELGADLSEKLKGAKQETPLLYALSRNVGIDVLKPLMTPTSLTDVNTSNHGVLWYAVFIHKDKEIIKHIIDQLNAYNISLSEIAAVISSNANTTLNDMLDAYLRRIADTFLDHSDCQDLGKPSDWQVQSKQKKKPVTTSEKEKVEQYFRSNNKKFVITKHALDRQNERRIRDEILCKLVLENLSKYSPKKTEKQSVKEGKIIILNGISDDQPFRVITSTNGNITSVLTTYWVTNNPMPAL